ncbi:TPM domain-containing protein [Bradyrhizobium sp.]
MKAARATLLALMLCWAFAAFADVAVPSLTGRVVDKTATLSSSDIASLDQTLRNFEARKGSQVAVLIVPTTQPETIEQYSIRVAEAWKIGRKKIDDGAILVVAKDDRKLRIEVGYGLEGALTDVTAKRIIDEVITPKFRSGDFAGGISDGVNRVLRVIDGEPLPAPAQRQQNSGLLSNFDPLNPFLIVAVIVVGGIFRGIFGRLLGSLATGGLVAALFWFIAASLALSAITGFIAFLVTMFCDAMTSSGGTGRGGGWVSSGGGGYSGGSSSSDSGGFSGGGGSFGGGGASGSW